ncbi:hypothetical protein GOODEAATRI_017466, partial [Goodea atripinnis]
KTDPYFKAFLDERNPKQQHSYTLESYLIKPIQRVLKYPLLLRELYSLTDPDSEEHYHLDASAPTRTLGRRKLVRNRFTIDTDIVFDGDSEQQDLATPQESDSVPLQQEDEPQSELAGDTDRWVEEQFDLEEYEDQEEMKETDILSDEDDEFCQTPRALSEEADLESPMMALSLGGAETDGSKSLQSPAVSETPDEEMASDTERKSSITDNSGERNQAEKDEVWVRRELSGSPPDGAT